MNRNALILAITLSIVAGLVWCAIFAALRPPPPQPPTGDAFAELCMQPGVVMCTGFDSTADIPDNEDIPNPENWRGISSYRVAPVIDTTIYNHGKGSLKFTIPGNSGAGDSGYWYSNWNPGFSNKFTAGSEFWIQWRQRFSPEFLASFNGNGWKTAILQTGDTPTQHYPGCPENEVVFQNTYYTGFLQAYDACAAHRSYPAFWDAWTNNSGQVTTNASQNNNHQQPAAGTCRSNSSPAYQDCLRFYPAEWMTFKAHVRLGTLNQDEWQNSLVELYIARQGQDGFLAIHVTMNLNASSVTNQQNIGRVQFLPYDSGRSGGSGPTAYTWYDDLVVSTRDISMTYGNQTRR